jgi:hypothetical protein
MVKKVYFDFNVFVNFLKKTEIQTTVIDFKKRGYVFYHSPAYLEEIANIG